MRFILPLLTGLALFQAAAFASPGKYDGTFEMDPKVAHKEKITGRMLLQYDDASLKAVKLTTDKPVFGKSVFPSTEQWSGGVATTANSPTVAAFKLQGPPHKWYYVLVAQTADGGGTLDGKLYKAASTLAEIQAAAKTSLNPIPTTWKAMGSAILKNSQ